MENIHLPKKSIQPHANPICPRKKKNVQSEVDKFSRRSSRSTTISKNPTNLLSPDLRFKKVPKNVVKKEVPFPKDKKEVSEPKDNKKGNFLTISRDHSLKDRISPCRNTNKLVKHGASSVHAKGLHGKLHRDSIGKERARRLSNGDEASNLEPTNKHSHEKLDLKSRRDAIAALACLGCLSHFNPDGKMRHEDTDSVCEGPPVRTSRLDSPFLQVIGLVKFKLHLMRKKHKPIVQKSPVVPVPKLVIQKTSLPKDDTERSSQTSNASEWVPTRTKSHTEVIKECTYSHNHSLLVCSIIHNRKKRQEEFKILNQKNHSGNYACSYNDKIHWLANTTDLVALRYSLLSGDLNESSQH